MEIIRKILYSLLMFMGMALSAMGDSLPCEWHHGNLVITADPAGYGMPLCEISFDQSRVKVVRGYLQGDRFGAWERARIFSRSLGVKEVEVTGYAMPYFDRAAAVVFEMYPGNEGK